MENLFIDDLIQSDGEITDYYDSILRFLGADQFLSKLGCNHEDVKKEGDYIEIPIKVPCEVNKLRISSEYFNHLEIEFWYKDDQNKVCNKKKYSNIHPTAVTHLIETVTSLPTALRYPTVPEIILHQLGDEDFIKKSNVYNLNFIDTEHLPQLEMDFKNKKGNYNYLKIKFNEQRNDYIMYFSKIMPDGVIDKLSEKILYNVPNELLKKEFTQFTGISLADTNARENISDYLEEQSTSTSSDLKKTRKRKKM